MKSGISGQMAISIENKNLKELLHHFPLFNKPDEKMILQMGSRFLEIQRGAKGFQ